MIEPFFFHDEKLFGCYHPSSNQNSSRLLVICPPFFDEYTRSYKALSDLANACSAQGVHVLRYDFYGTGESQGDLDQTTLKDWVTSVDTAIEEGIALSGAKEVFLLGVRFGATLAGQSKHSKIKRYIFWDPILSGKRYIEWLNKIDQELEKKHIRLARYANKPFRNIAYQNFSLPENLRKDIIELTLSEDKLRDSTPTFIISTDKTSRLSKLFTNYEYCGISYDWPAFPSGLITLKPALETICRRVIAQ